MKRFALSLIVLMTAGLVYAQGLNGRGYQNASVLIPDTSIEHLADVGVNAHTNHLILVSPEFTGTSPAGETPSSIASVYQLPSPAANPSMGAGYTIAIVDAFDYPTAENDLGVFSSAFNLPACTTANGCFQKVYASGSKPRTNGGWSQEAALDIEWAHSMAPGAKIVLVEAATNSFTNLFKAVDAATQIVKANGGKGLVSMSWGGSEFSSEANNDVHFENAAVVYFASSGDTGGATIYPGVSPNVVCAGGTTINRDSSGNFVSETGWSGSGGGPSKYESKPSYQQGVSGTSATQRSAPDFSFDADPNSGVSVYDSTKYQGNVGWLVFGGTSVSSPSLSGIVASAGSITSSSTSVSEDTLIYSGLGGGNFRDITQGTAGSFSCSAGWDFVTGVGSDIGLVGK